MNPIILLCRNGLAYSRACLPTLLNQTIPVEALLVNNGSTDGTGRWAASQAGIHLISHERPVSVSEAWNSGLTWWFGKGAKHVLVVNNDTKLRADTYASLLVCLPGSGMITCVSTREEKELTKPLQEITSSPHPDFSCFLLTKDAYRTVGPFDEGFKGAYFEDNDYHCRMFKAGVGAVSISVPFLHYGSGTINHASETEKQAISDAFTNNKARFIKKWGFAPGSGAYTRFFQRGGGES